MDNLGIAAARVATFGQQMINQRWYKNNEEKEDMKDEIRNRRNKETASEGQN